ncbi:MAG TPA: hypothetical protein PKA82_11500 [Pyrinomonadaceae bacterium]|nr:hypothetical protein [Pyrinomonadaceae bacterium]
MKIGSYYSTALAIILLISAGVCLAQETTVSIEKGGKKIDLSQVLTDENGKKVLILTKDEFVEFALDPGVVLKSSDTSSVDVLGDRTIKGVTVGKTAVITAQKPAGTDLTIKGVGKLTVMVVDAISTRQITAQSTFLSYNTVRNNFGKKFAKSYFVIQVDIRNETLDKQFIVQTLDVLVDPNQCYNGRYLYEGFNYTECLSVFNTYFKFPTAQQGIRREEVIGSAKADFERSNRNVGFRILAFVSNLGTILTGFEGVMGPDGYKGINLIGTTFTAAANGLFPDTSAEKLENLKNALPTEDVIIKSKESRTFNIFIPTERIFYNDSWAKYIQPPQTSETSTHSFKSVLDLLLLSSATGVMVANDAPKVQVKSDDQLQKQAQKFGLAIAPSTETDRLRSLAYNNRLVRLESDLKSGGIPADKAEKSLQAIALALKNELRFIGFLEAKKIDGTSKAADIIKAIDELISTLGKEDAINNFTYIIKLQEIVATVGK